MTYKLWEESLLNYLKSLSKEEKEEILSYYREMYNDKLDTGIPESEIVDSFGDPMIAAARILKEGADEVEQADARHSEREGGTDKKPSEEAVAPVSNKKAEKQGDSGGISASRIVGWVFITLLLIIPLFAVVLSVIASLTAITLSGGAMLVFGVIGAVASPFLLLFGNTLGNVLLVLGGTLITAGIGALLLISFYHITKYSVVSVYKITRHVVRRKK